MVNGVRFVISKEDLASGPGSRLDHTRAVVWQRFYYGEKSQRKLVTETSEVGQRVPPP